MKKHIKRIMAALVALIICVVSVHIPVKAASSDFMIWTEDSESMYENTTNADYVFACTDNESIAIYEYIAGLGIDFKQYDEVYIYTSSKGVGSGTRIKIYCYKNPVDTFLMFAGRYVAAPYLTNGDSQQIYMCTKGFEVLDTWIIYYENENKINLSSSSSLTMEDINSWVYSSDSGLYTDFISSSDAYTGGCLLYSTGTVALLRDVFSAISYGGSYNDFVASGSIGNDIASEVLNGNVTNYASYGYGYDGSEFKSYDASAPAYTANNELCFDTFLVEKINHPDLLGGTGARVQYSYGDKLFEAIQNDKDYSMKMHFDIQIVYRYNVFDDGLINANNFTETLTLYDEVEQDIELRNNQDGLFVYDLLDTVNPNEYPVLYSYLYAIDNSYVDGWGARATYDYISSLTFIDSDKIHDFFNLDFGDECSIDYLEVIIEGRVYDYSDSIIMSNSGKGSVNFISGQNSHYVNTYNPDTGESEKGSTMSGNNHYNVVVETDSGGNKYYNYYYYDTTNNTVTPSVGTVANTLMLTFANPLKLEGVNIDNSSNSSSSGGGGSGGYDLPNIIIEDDDYTDTALREDLKDGFGLFDDSSTDIKADGYLNMAAAFFNNIDPELQGILTFGISSVVVIGILRSVFRR